MGDDLYIPSKFASIHFRLSGNVRDLFWMIDCRAVIDRVLTH
jgi:hypothetical protein